MANRFTIVIDALDNATKKIRKVKGEFSSFVKPISQMTASFKRLSKEVGLDKIGKSIKSVGKVAFSVVGRIATLATALAGIVGVGSIVAVAAYAREWAFAGAQVARTAVIIGMGAFKLQSLEGAAQLAGLSTGSLTSSIKTLGDTMEDALYGRNQDALVVLNRLGVSIRKTKDGSIDLARALPDIADGISKLKSAQARGVAARALGVEELLPFLVKGRKGIAEYQKIAEKTGAILSGPALEGAMKFQRAIVEMRMSLTGLANNIMSKLGPALMPYIDKFSNWLIANRNLITSGFVSAVSDMAKSLSSFKMKDLIQVAKDLGDFGRSIAAMIAWLNRNSDGFNNFMNSPGATSAQASRNALDHLNKMPVTTLFSDIAKSAWEGLKSSFGSSLGVRQNNPGNLRSWGNTPVANGFAAFPSAQAGLSAMAKQLRLYDGRGINTISSIVNRWAPKKDRNNVPAYIADLVKHTGFAANTHLNLSDTKTLSSLMKAMIRHEQGGVPYDDSMIARAAAGAGDRGSHHKIEVSGSIKGANVKARVTSHTGDGATTYINNLALGSLPL